MNESVRETNESNDSKPDRASRRGQAALEPDKLPARSACGDTPLRIAHLYPELLNLYGDKGNIASFTMRLRWRGLESKVREIRLQDELDLSDVDILFLGGGSDREQAIVCDRLLGHAGAIREYAEKDGVLVAVCGGYQLLGKSYAMGEQTLEGLGLLDLDTVAGATRLIGNVAIQSPLIPEPIVGFENHAGRTRLGPDVQPLGKVLSGYGNNGEDGVEGVMWNNVIGTYLHGPLLPKNPALSDHILLSALRRRDPGFEGLAPLDDEPERRARLAMLARMKV